MSCGLLPDHPALVFRINDNGVGPELLRQVFLERGWSEFDEEIQLEYDWNLWWRTSRFRTSDYHLVYPWQRLNHYPKSTLITKKDSLARNLKRMRCVHGANVFNFSPLSFNLPNDYTKYVKVYGTLRQKADGKTAYWICKPADLSRGRGIFIFRDLSELLYDCNAVLQQYIDNPLLIGGYKSDLRIYVAVTSFHPLMVYVHEEGIVRFSTEKFDLNSTKNIFAHLTNTSINKHSPGYTEDKERVGPGCKWTLTQLRRYFLSNNINDHRLWRRIVNIVILTVLVQAPQVQKVENCFELYGFDILIDENLKPWLLEVNFSPSLTSDCQVDILAKKPMLHDLMDLLHYTSADAERGGENFRHYFKTFAGREDFQKRGFIQPQKGVGSNKRGDKHRGQGRKVSRIQGGRTDSSRLGGSRENVAGGTTTAGHVNSCLEDGMGREERKGGPRGLSHSSKEETEERARNFNCGDDFSAVVDGAKKHERGEKGDSAMDQAVISEKLLVESEQPSFPSPLGEQHSKTTVSADSHNSGGSEDSKVSKVSTDSGVGGASKPTGSSAHTPYRNVFGSQPEISSLHRAGSGVRRRDSGCGEELSLHLPSLENSASSRQSKKGVLTPRSMYYNPGDPAEGSASVQQAHFSHPIHKAVSTKSLQGTHIERANRWRQHVVDPQSMTHRSAASVATVTGGSGVRAGSRLSPHLRKQSSMSQLPNLPPTSRFMQAHHHQPQFPPPNRTVQQSSFSHLKQRAGHFFLVFPFNEATLKAATTLDAKVVIRETQNLMKEALNAVSSSKSGPDHSVDDSSVSRDGEELWAPLKVSEEDV